MLKQPSLRRSVSVCLLAASLLLAISCLVSLAAAQPVQWGQMPQVQAATQQQAWQIMQEQATNIMETAKAQWIQQQNAALAAQQQQQQQQQQQHAYQQNAFYTAAVDDSSLLEELESHSAFPPSLRVPAPAGPLVRSHR